MADEHDEHGALFVYGTLMFDAVLVTLLKRLPKSHPARLKGYRRFAIRDRVYPAIVPEAGSSVCGLVLLGLTAEERRILDEFEDEDYIKTPLTVHVHAALANAIDTGTGAATAAGAGIAAAGTSVDASATFRSSMCATKANAEEAQRDAGVSAPVETLADVYVWRAEFADELEGDWDAAAFGSGGGSSACSHEGEDDSRCAQSSGRGGDELTRYVAMCRQWVEADYDWGRVEE